MTKFEEKLEKLPIKNIEHPIGDTKYYAAVHVKTLIAQADEEYQELFDKYSNLNDSYEKEVIRSSKLESQIIDLKSQLQQQALPVVPEEVDKAIKYLSLIHIYLYKKGETEVKKRLDEGQQFNRLSYGKAAQQKVLTMTNKQKYDLVKAHGWDCVEPITLTKLKSKFGDGIEQELEQSIVYKDKKAPLKWDA